MIVHCAPPRKRLKSAKPDMRPRRYCFELRARDAEFGNNYLIPLIRAVIGIEPNLKDRYFSLREILDWLRDHANCPKDFKAVRLPVDPENIFDEITRVTFTARPPICEKLRIACKIK